MLLTFFNTCLVVFNSTFGTYTYHYTFPQYTPSHCRIGCCWYTLKLIGHGNANNLVILGWLNIAIRKKNCQTWIAILFIGTLSNIIYLWEPPFQHYVLLWLVAPECNVYNEPYPPPWVQNMLLPPFLDASHDRQCQLVFNINFIILLSPKGKIIILLIW